jgi:hypothetical protein
MKRVLLTAVAGILLVGLHAPVASAAGLLRADIVGNEVNGQVVAGIPGGAPWVVDDGHVVVSRLFHAIALDVEGLLLLDGTVGPVFEVIASLHCSSGGPGEEVFTEVARTKSHPLSPEGNVKLFEFFDVPDQCTAAIVLVRVKVIDAGFIGGTPGEPLDLEDIGVVPPWIAASGL